MHFNNSYLEEVYGIAAQRDSDKPEFLQTVKEMFTSIEPLVEKEPFIRREAILERVVEPERVIQFRVPWEDRNGDIHVNRGYRAQFNSALGPYKGGIRFHKTVNPSVIYFLGFEQTFKNSLTGLPLGGGKGGSDFDPHGKNDREVMRFCQSFMAELQKHIGAKTDVPAGDIGVGSREVGYMFGQFVKMRNLVEGAMTGKSIDVGGSLLRTEATGYGICYFTAVLLEKMLDTTFYDKTVVVSGSGNVAIYTIEKAQQMGAHVITASDSNGYVLDEEGIDVALLKQIKEVERGRISEYAERKPGAQYFEGHTGIWDVPCDIAIPCATQNEIDLEAAKKLIANGVQVVVEGSNMSSTAEAVEAFRSTDNNVIIAPSKAANAGGVACSGLEMQQNAGRTYWTAEKVDRKLRAIMENIFNASYENAQIYNGNEDLVSGANIAGFAKVARAMAWKGIV